MDRFKDRVHAGRFLAERLKKYAHKPQTIVLGLPRGGVVVAHEIAEQLGLPLDIFLVRKLGVPGYEELAMGAIASGGVRVLNQDVLRSINISRDEIQSIAEREEQELKRRENAYRSNRPRTDLKGYTVILVDDGLATGATMRAAVLALRKQNPEKIIIAVPTAAPNICADFRARVDEIVCGMTPSPFNAVGMWYEDFSQTSDEEVKHLLKESHVADTSRGNIQ